MCFPGCGEDRFPNCDYCGCKCFGDCENPDVCHSCWHLYSVTLDRDYGDIGGELRQECVDGRCTCQCHEDDSDDLSVLKSFEGNGAPYERKGIFPFLNLPGEIREKIYGFAFLQEGEQRNSDNHRGSIHTALLGTCRQIYSEARPLPLTLNKLCFSSGLFTLDFLGFLLEPTQRDLVTGMHIESNMSEFENPSWHLLLRELAKMPITHLGLTVKGDVSKQIISRDTYFTNRFKVLKKLETFDLVLTSVHLKIQDEKDIQEEMREALIKDYECPNEQRKLKDKRAAPTDVVAGSRKATKKPKKANTSMKYQSKIFVSPKSNQLSFKSQKPKRDTAQAAKKRAKQILLDQYNQLKQYATSLDRDVAPVKIRLKQAREAAEAIDETNFEKLAHGILLTLEDRYTKIATARMDLSFFRAPLPSAETVSWSISNDSSDSKDPSQALM